jgi:glyoxylase-like metal-dependent hydrolase (beta-lactamase superfamily II)
MNINEVNNNIYLIDNKQYYISRLGSVYLINEDKKILIETGPATSANVVLNTIKYMGLKPNDIDYIILTHIHLDHAGGAGTLLHEMGNAKVLVHPNGLKHLLHPNRLVAGTIKALGKDAMSRCGEVTPVPRNRIEAVSDNQKLLLSAKQHLVFIDAPGHAPHHLCIYEHQNQGIFSGDAIALYLPYRKIFLPFHPPPSYDPQKSINTISHLIEFNPKLIYYSHFGISTQVLEDMNLALRKLKSWDDKIVTMIQQGKREQRIADELIKQELDEIDNYGAGDTLYNYLAEVHLPLVAWGHIQSYKQRIATSNNYLPS